MVFMTHDINMKMMEVKRTCTPAKQVQRHHENQVYMGVRLTTSQKTNRKPTMKKVTKKENTPSVPF
jgi:hypothetical protein